MLPYMNQVTAEGITTMRDLQEGFQRMKERFEWPDIVVQKIRAKIDEIIRSTMTQTQSA